MLLGSKTTTIRDVCIPIRVFMLLVSAIPMYSEQSQEEVQCPEPLLLTADNLTYKDG